MDPISQLIILQEPTFLHKPRILPENLHIPVPQLHHLKQTPNKPANQQQKQIQPWLVNAGPLSAKANQKRTKKQ